MADIDTVRTLCQDSPLPSSLTQDFTGGLYFQLSDYPVLEASVIITGSGTVPAFTVDYSVGLITFASDPRPQNLTIRYKQVLLLDSQIQSLLDLNAAYGDPIRVTAADCLDAVASNQALVLKKIRMLDLQTDGPAVAESLRKSAIELRKLVFSQDYNEPAFDIAEEVYDGAGWKEKVIKDWMRQV